MLTVTTNWKGRWCEQTSLETGQLQLPNRAVTSHLGSPEMCYFKRRYNIRGDTGYPVDSHIVPEREDTKYLIAFILVASL